MIRQEIIPPRKPRRGALMRSARWNLQRMVDLREQAERGLRGSADAQRLHTMASLQFEAFMSRQTPRDAGSEGQNIVGSRRWRGEK
jgi:hypothetical protein